MSYDDEDKRIMEEVSKEGGQPAREPGFTPGLYVDGQKMEPAHMGACPYCYEMGIQLHLGKHNYCICEEHGVKWYVGYGLVSLPPDDMEPDLDEYFRRNEARLSKLRLVDPSHWEIVYDETDTTTESQNVTT